MTERLNKWKADSLPNQKIVNEKMIFFNVEIFFFNLFIKTEKYEKIFVPIYVL